MKNEHKYTFKMIKLDDILKTGDLNCRKFTDTSDLEASIKEHGIINPVTVTPIADGYQLLAGFRRCFAAQHLGMDKVPCHVYDDSDTSLQEIQVTENISRMDMTQVEECMAVAHLISKKNTPKTVARKFGKSLRWVLVRKKVADAGEDALKMLADGKLELAAAAKLADIPDEDFKQIVKDYDRITKDNVEQILSRFHLDLDKAPFNHDKCLKCAKCSACQCDLFADEPKAYCLDPECYQKKVQKEAKERVKKMVADGVKAHLGKFHSWGLLKDDDDYGHEVKSYHSKYKDAQDANIAKRIAVDPDTCEVYEYFDERDIPGYVEETEEEIEARHEEENRQRKLNGIRCNMYKDRLQAGITKVCSANIDWLLVLMFLNSNDPGEILSEEVAKKFGLWDEKENYTRNFWNGDNDFDALSKIPLKDIIQGIVDSVDELFGNLYYCTERMEFVYKLICGKDPKKLTPSESAVQKEYERQENEDPDD